MATTQASVGTEITLHAQEDEILVVRLVAPGNVALDVDPMQISALSPLGSALNGRRIGESVTVETPSGIRTYWIVDIAEPTFNGEASFRRNIPDGRPSEPGIAFRNKER